VKSILLTLLAGLASFLLAFLLLELSGTKVLLFAFLSFAIFLLTLHFLCQKHLSDVQGKFENASRLRDKENRFDVHLSRRLLLILAEELAKSYPPCRALRALKEFLKGSKGSRSLSPLFFFSSFFYFPSSRENHPEVKR